MLADQIAKMIEEMLEASGGSLELQRNEMAGRLGCVPSQISYVLTSRFTPERGYIVESRRGGGGCIRIVRKQMHRDEYLMHFFYAIGNDMDERTLEAYVTNLLDNEFIDGREKNMIMVGILIYTFICIYAYFICNIGFNIGWLFKCSLDTTS